LPPVEESKMPPARLKRSRQQARSKATRTAVTNGRLNGRPKSPDAHVAQNGRRTKPDVLNLFVSFKSKDQAVANQFKELLERLVPAPRRSQLSVFVSSGIPAGDDWVRHVHEALRTCDCFILLYTDPQMEWTWCLYESGFYVGNRLEREMPNRKLVVLHSPDVTPPSPLLRWQAVPARLPAVRKLLTDLFSRPIGDNHQAIMPDVEQYTAFEETAKAIAHLIGPSAEREYYTRYVQVFVSAEDVQHMRETGELPAAAEVESDQRSLQLFGRRPPGQPRGLFPVRSTWPQVVQRVQSEQSSEFGEWHRSLVRGILDAIDGNDFSPELPRFRSIDGTEFYPTIQILDRFSNGSFAAYVIFSQVLPEHDPRPPDEMGTVSNMLTVARHFHWGVCERFERELARLEVFPAAGGEAIARTIDGLATEIYRSMTKSTSAELLTVDRPLRAMVTAEDRAEIKAIYREWDVIKPSLTKALADKHLEDTLRVLQVLRELNRRFLRLAAKRYYEQLCEMS
jgi:TIR domain